MNLKSAHFLPGTNKKLGDKYLLLECLGDGSHGWVWRAERLADGAVVAVKIPKDLTKEDRHLAEGKELLEIEPHPNVVRITDMGRIPPENEWFFIEMEYFPSQSLAQKLEQRSQQFGDTFERLFNIFDQVLAAVEFLAALSPPVSHGDIKPHNILIGASDLVKLTDFGSSALPDEIYVRTRENGGTVLYAAPEFSDSASRKGTFDALLRGDIYSLGVLLYQLLTGQLPHDTPAQVRRHAPFKRPTEINGGIHPLMEQVVLRCLEKDPPGRFGTVVELRQAFASARALQLSHPRLSLPIAAGAPHEDWSTAVVGALEAKDYLRAAKLSATEYARSKDLSALLQQLNALYRANRFFDFKATLEREAANLVGVSGDDARGIRDLSIKVMLKLREVDSAGEILAQARTLDGDSLELDFLQASLHGLQAEFTLARQLLERINRATPSKPQVLVKLIQVCEQMRDYPAAVGYLKHALRIVRDAADLEAKRQRYQALGIW